MQAEMAKAFEVHPSTVKRWLEGGEIPPPMLKLLDFYFFGTIPPRVSNSCSDPHGVLDFDEAEWAIIGNLARREGVTEAQWIAGRIRAYLAWQSGNGALQSLPSPQAFIPRKTNS